MSEHRVLEAVAIIDLALIGIVILALIYRLDRYFAPEDEGRVTPEEPPAPRPSLLETAPGGPDRRLAWGWVGCVWRGRHDPVRHPLGGFRCVDCGIAGATLEEMGL